MNSNQRVIKYLAMAFAVMLAVGIISAIATLSVNVLSLVTGKPFWGDRERIDFTKEFTNVKNLDISNTAGDLYIVVGDTFRVEAVDVIDSFQAEVSSDGLLTISENMKHPFQWFIFSGIKSLRSKITVYLPKDFLAGNVNLESGAGSVIIDALKTDQLTIDTGVGDIKGSNMIADEVKIDVGVGDITLTEVSLEDTDFDSGVGEIRIEGELLGDNKIDCGIGEADLDLRGSEEDYYIDMDSGVGTIRVNGEKIKKTNRNHTAKHSISINGGIGDIKINFKND